jgi:hypothetical protein
LIVLEGCSAAGKTHLAALIGNALPDCFIVETDKFIERRGVGYVAGLGIEALKTALSEGLGQSRIVILEGVCARDFLEKTDLEPALFVYVQRNSAVGLEGDLDILDQEEDNAPPYEHATQDGLLDIEIACYHHRQRPRGKANILYIRTESPGPPSP